MLVHYFLWLAACLGVTKFVAEGGQDFLAELDFWFRSGRTILSLHLMLLSLLPVYLQCLFLRWDFEDLTRNPRGKYWAEQAFWKDPMAENLYII